MSTSAHAPSGRRVLSDLGGLATLVLVLWAIALVGTVLVLIIVEVVTGVTTSGWEVAAGAIAWMPFVFAINVVGIYLTAGVAHGQTRRDFTIETLVSGVAAAGMFAALTAVGYLVERAAYGLTGWSQRLTSDHLFTTPTQAHLVLVEYWPHYAAFAMLGVMVGAAFYRNMAWGLASVLAVLGSLVLINLVVHGSPEITWIPMGDEAGTPAVMAVRLAVGALAAALSWLALRNVPIRAKPN